MRKLRVLVAGDIGPVCGSIVPALFEREIQGRVLASQNSRAGHLTPKERRWVNAEKELYAGNVSGL